MQSHTHQSQPLDTAEGNDPLERCFRSRAKSLINCGQKGEISVVFLEKHGTVQHASDNSVFVARNPSSAVSEMEFEHSHRSAHSTLRLIRLAFPATTCMWFKNVSAPPRNKNRIDSGLKCALDQVSLPTETLFQPCMHDLLSEQLIGSCTLQDMSSDDRVSGLRGPCEGICSDAKRCAKETNVFLGANQICLSPKRPQVPTRLC